MLPIHPMFKGTSEKEITSLILENAVEFWDLRPLLLFVFETIDGKSDIRKYL